MMRPRLLSPSLCQANRVTDSRFGPVHPITDDALDALRQELRLAKERDLRARERMTDRQPGELCFALLGLSVERERRLGEYATVRPIEEPPLAGSLFEVISDKAQAAALGRWIDDCQSELVIARDLAEASDPQRGLDLGWNAIAALRIRSDCEFLVPGVADRSWDTVAGCEFDECWALALEDNPRAIRLNTASDSHLSHEDAAWVERSLGKLLELRAERRFHFALESLSDSQSLSDLRMMTAMLWSGLEALIDVSQEIRFRISALLATLTTTRGPDRYSAYKEILKLYDVRSKAVHGAQLTKSELVRHVLAVKALLRQCLSTTLDHGGIYSRDDLEEELMGS
jgi:Apea-like HEPN